VEAYSGAQLLGVNLRVQRYASDRTGASDAYAEISAGSAQALIQVNPLWSLDAVTGTGTVDLIGDDSPAFTDDGSPVLTSGFAARRKLTLPAGTTALVLTVHLGPSTALAAEGVRLSLPFETIPVVSEFATQPAGGSSLVY